MNMYQFDIYADYFQFYVEDSDTNIDLSDSWLPEDSHNMIAFQAGNRGGFAADIGSTTRSHRLANILGKAALRETTAPHEFPVFASALDQRLATLGADTILGCYGCSTRRLSSGSASFAWCR